MQARVVLILATLSFLLPLSVNSQAVHPNAAIKIIDTLETPSICDSHRVLKMQTVVLNTSNSGIPIDLRRLGNANTSYVGLIDTEKMEYRLEAISHNLDSMGTPPKITWTTLNPGSFYHKEYEIPLQEDFFNKDGYYRINLTTSVQTKDQGRITSDYSFIFEIRSCEE
jgi:hypothetical protein